MRYVHSQWFRVDPKETLDYKYTYMYLLWWYGIELGVAEQGQPLSLLGTHREEGGGWREGVTATECLHQRPLLLRLKTTSEREIHVVLTKHKTSSYHIQWTYTCTYM